MVSLDLEKLAWTGNPDSSERFGKVAEITGDQKVYAASYRIFEKAVVIRITGCHHAFLRLNPLSQGPESLKNRFPMRPWNTESGSANDLLLFVKYVN